MKNIGNKNLFFSILLAGTVVLFIIWYLLYALFQSSKVTQSIGMSGEILRQSLLFGGENFYTQLKILEYAYEPSLSGKEGFLEHKQKLIEYFNNLQNAVETNAGTGILYETGLDDFSVIGNDFEVISKSWEGLLNATDEYREAINLGDSSSEELDRLKNNIHQIVIENETIFDNFDFDDKVGNFLFQQEKHTASLNDKSLAIQKQIMILLLVLACIYMVLLFCIAIWLGRIIKKINLDKPA